MASKKNSKKSPVKKYLSPLTSSIKLSRQQLITVCGGLAMVGIVAILLAHAYGYNPYNPASETGQATWYNNSRVGGVGHCAAVHYLRGKTIQVRNNANGKAFTCLVSDAGPFYGTRIVDLNPNDFAAISQRGKGEGVLNVTLTLQGASTPPPPPTPTPVPTPAPPPPPPPSGNPYACSSRPTLQQGSTGVCVQHLQWILINRFGYGSIINPNGGTDGSFGPATKRAVQQFQLDHHVPNSACGTVASSCDGVVGPTTWSYLEN